MDSAERRCGPRVDGAREVRPGRTDPAGLPLNQFVHRVEREDKRLHKPITSSIHTNHRTEGRRISWPCQDRAGCIQVEPKTSCKRSVPCSAVHGESRGRHEVFSLLFPVFTRRILNLTSHTHFDTQHDILCPKS